MDIKLNYTEKGQGEPLILLHGNGEDYTYFSHQLDCFSKKCRVIAVDTRGHGKSPRGRKPFTITQFAEDLYDFMKSQGIEKADLLGFSDGGNIALTFALKHPDMVSRLILNGANLYPGGVRACFQLPIILEYHLAFLLKGRGEKHMRKYELLSLMVKEPQIRPEELKALNIRTLVIAGKKDMIKESHSRLIHKSLPDSRLRIIDGDHFIAQKEHISFNTEVADFLGLC